MPTHAFGEQLTDEVSVLDGGCHDISTPTVATYDSVYRYVNECGDRFGLPITDETHHLAAETYLQIPEIVPVPYHLGLTATYGHANRRETLLEDRMGSVVYGEDVDTLTGDFLSEYEATQMLVDLTPVEQTEYDEEYQIYRDYVDSRDSDPWKEQGYAGFLKRTSYDPQGRRAPAIEQRAEHIARTVSKKLDTFDSLFKHHHSDRVTVFTTNNDFVYDISRKFILPCIAHQTDTDERTEIFDRFRSGEYSILTISQILDEGIDVPAANVGITLLESASKRQYTQQPGRIPCLTDGRQPARLYEVITADTMETYVSQRRCEGMGGSADS